MSDTTIQTPDAVQGQPIIEISGMHKWYGDFHVLNDINLQVQPQERIVICGPSGSGKSTLIRCINRLEEHQKGKIVVDGIELTNDLKNIEKVRAEVGMVFQHFNLFPHLTILQNLTLGPIWVRRTPKKEAEETAMRYLEKPKPPDSLPQAISMAFIPPGAFMASPPPSDSSALCGSSTPRISSYGMARQ